MKDQIDEWFNYSLDGCPVCAGELELMENKNQVIQQIEIVDVPISVSEHIGMAYWCPKCKKHHYAPIPDDIKKAGLCGPNFTALIGYMKSALHASFTTIRKFVRDVLKVSISRAQLKRLIDKVGWSLDAPYDELLNRIPLETKLNVDETGHKDKGERFWTWCFKADLYTLFKIDKSRGSKVLIDVLGKEFDGIIGCDYFSAYRKYMKDFNVTVQFCLAHLIRDIRFLTTLPDKDEKEFGKRLLAEIKRMFKIIHENRANPRHTIKEELRQVQKAIMNVAFEVPVKLDNKGKRLKSKSVNITERLRKHGDAFFQFITTPEIDPTNNIAEQAIRFVVIDRHITQGTRSESGRRNCERLWTVLATCETTGKSAFNFIKRAVESFMTSSSAPSLLEPDTG